jgi:uncharacterized cupin superfamily protein/RimJ/RimL family protein N-acetyltransferase
MKTLQELILHYGDAQKAGDRDGSIQIKDTDFGRKFSADRLAVHYVILPPHSRSSYPHAESLEEEFAFVINGHPHLWINGKVLHLDPGHAVGFPAGTGIAHNFINNSDKDIHLLVVGEKTKKDNLCSFPVNPELQRTQQKIWWSDYPKQELGSHKGDPGTISEEQLAKEWPSFLVQCQELQAQASFHYAGDNETFGDGVRLTKTLGLKALGIWYEVLAPGKRSSWPHAHTHEEEFAFILQGEVSVWMNGQVFPARSGTGVFFPPNTGISHCLINESDRPVIYMAIGETQEFTGEKIYYPLHPLRNEECRRKNYLWDNPPFQQLGPHPGKDQRPQRNHLRLQPCTKSDLEQILEVFEASPDYFLKVDGCLPNKEIVLQTLTDGPKEKSADYFKEFLLIERDGKFIGAVDLHAHHRDKGTTYLGLFLINEKLQGQGLGRQCYLLIEDYIQRAYQCQKILLGIHEDNQVANFWKKMGFAVNGKTYEWEGEQKNALVTEYEKSLTPK